jgi:heterodisulfide reductase subunit C
MGCKICSSVCTVNELSIEANPQELLSNLFLGRKVYEGDKLVRYCTGCYNCTEECPWKIRIPEIIRALRKKLLIMTPFERAFKESIDLWGRVYEPYVFLKAFPFLLKEGYMKHIGRWKQYISIHLPRKVGKGF